ncbi:MobA/MobL family protein [Helicobacter sp. UBA3407]|mgnify:CR=1 FL=1|uniref:MobA/MobL family protein n=3 Tax=Pseudomonadati TaxID=3379134 RepID=UPI00260D2B16|nr:MobA/MobL family protein [Helicobacter sp. UBA3407]MCI9053510.1 MobA/MobL family protein [Lachnospiraceae bacterium]
MAIYHCNISNVSRAKGSTSCATLSYITGQKVKDERLDTTFDYGRKERVLFTGTILPEHAPIEYQNASVLFNAIEKHEKAENARTGKKIEVALPREFDLDKQREVVENFIKENITSRGYACTYGIHSDKENHNPHAHILMVNRQIDNKGQWSSKRKMEYALDEQGQRIPQIDKETGLQKTDKNGRKQWKRINTEVNPLDQKETLKELRERWALECNKHLAAHQRIDHRSLTEQGKEQIPTIHEGYASRQIEKRGEVSERAEYNREVANINRERKIIEQGIADNQAFIKVLKETDSRLQDLQSVDIGTEKDHRYNFFYDTVISTIERERKVPVLYSQGKSAVVLAQDTPQKALSLLQATKEKWGEFIRELHESVKNAHTDDLSKSEGENTTKPKKTHTSLFERVRGVYEGIQKKQAEKQEQKRQELEEAKQREKERQAIIDKLNTPVNRYDNQQRLEQLDFVAKVWSESKGDPVLQEQAFKKLGEITDLKTKEYDHNFQLWSDRRVGEVPKEEVDGAIKKAREGIKADIEKDNQLTIRQKLREIQEQNKDKMAQRQAERQRTQNKSRGRDDR